MRKESRAMDSEWALEFQKWFEKQTYEKENVEL